MNYEWLVDLLYLPQYKMKVFLKFIVCKMRGHLKIMHRV